MRSNRRKLLKAITLGGSAVTAWKIPADWSRPVVESVTLPAHAQTTGEDNVPNIVTTGTIDTTDPTLGFHDRSILDTLAQPAYAGPPQPSTDSFDFSICIRVNRQQGFFDAFVIVYDGGFPSYRGTGLAVGGDDKDLSFDGSCSGFVDAGNVLITPAYATAPGVQVNVSNVTATGATVKVDIESSRFTGFLKWGNFNCGLDCDSLQLPPGLL